MDNFTFNKEVFTTSFNKLKDEFSCKDVYNVVLKSYNIILLKQSIDIGKFIQTMCRDSLSLKKNSNYIMADLIDITICLIIIKKKNCNENMKKEFIKKINNILEKYT